MKKQITDQKFLLDNNKNDGQRNIKIHFNQQKEL